MTSLVTQTGFDAEAYVAWEDRQAEKHEYLRGEVFAMVGARREHVLVSGNLYAAFKQRLRGGLCQAYVSDLKLRVEAADAFFTPTSWCPAVRGIMQGASSSSIRP